MLYIDDHIDELDLTEALRLVSGQRREAALRFSHEAGRRQSLAAYLLLMRGLSREYGIEEPPAFEFGEHGKPRLQGRPDIHFSLSHCRQAAVCALSSRRVGVDVESIGRYREGVARYTMNDEEMGLILGAERPDVAFTRLWTMKEARQKLTGEGIVSDMKQVLAKGDCRFETVVNLERGYVYTLCEDTP